MLTPVPDTNAALDQRIAGDSAYLKTGAGRLTWFRQTGMINSSHLVNDGIDLSTRSNNGDVAWSYNQGVSLAALTELSKATNNTNGLRRYGPIDKLEPPASTAPST